MLNATLTCKQRCVGICCVEQQAAMFPLGCAPICLSSAAASAALTLRRWIPRADTHRPRVATLSSIVARLPPRLRPSLRFPLAARCRYTPR